MLCINSACVSVRNALRFFSIYSFYHKEYHLYSIDCAAGCSQANYRLPTMKARCRNVLLTFLTPLNGYKHFVAFSIKSNMCHNISAMMSTCPSSPRLSSSDSSTETTGGNKSVKANKILKGISIFTKCHGCCCCCCGVTAGA